MKSKRNVHDANEDFRKMSRNFQNIVWFAFRETMSTDCARALIIDSDYIAYIILAQNYINTTHLEMSLNAVEFSKSSE